MIFLTIRRRKSFSPFVSVVSMEEYMRKNLKKYAPQSLRLLSLVAILLVFSLILTSCTTNNDAGNQVANDTLEDTEEAEARYEREI